MWRLNAAQFGYCERSARALRASIARTCALSRAHSRSRAATRQHETEAVRRDVHGREDGVLVPDRVDNVEPLEEQHAGHPGVDAAAVEARLAEGRAEVHEQPHAEARAQLAEELEVEAAPEDARVELAANEEVVERVARRAALGQHLEPVLRAGEGARAGRHEAVRVERERQHKGEGDCSDGQRGPVVEHPLEAVERQGLADARHRVVAEGRAQLHEEKEARDDAEAAEAVEPVAQARAAAARGHERRALALVAGHDQRQQRVQQKVGAVGQQRLEARGGAHGRRRDAQRLLRGRRGAAARKAVAQRRHELRVRPLPALAAQAAEEEHEQRQAQHDADRPQQRAAELEVGRGGGCGGSGAARRRGGGGG